jgi:hypothetical protein
MSSAPTLFVSVALTPQKILINPQQRLQMLEDFFLR